MKANTAESKIIQFTERQILNRLRKMDALKAEADLLKAEADSIRAELVSALGVCEIDNDYFKLKYTEYEEHGLDTKTLKKERPELWETFPKVTHKTRFTYSVK